MIEKDSSPSMWVTDDIFFFPENFLGLKKPDGGVFLSLEGQSTDDGKVFINAFQDQEFTNYAITVVRKYEVPNLLGNAKIFMRNKSFKQNVIEDESEHGVAYWDIDDERSVAMVFSTQGSDLLVDQAMSWLGEAKCTGVTPIHGRGNVSVGLDKTIDSLQVPEPVSVKKQKIK